MENIDHEVNIKKIERVHRAKENRPGRNLPVITKLNDQNLSKKAETSFIKAEKAGNERTPIFFWQIYSPALSTKRNKAMKKRIELEEEE